MGILYKYYTHNFLPDSLTVNSDRHCNHHKIVQLEPKLNPKTGLDHHISHGGSILDHISHGGSTTNFFLSYY